MRKKISTRKTILNYLNESSGRTIKLKTATRINRGDKNAVGAVLSKMVKSGELTRISRGSYTLPGVSTPVAKTKATTHKTRSTQVTPLGNITDLKNELVAKRDALKGQITSINNEITLIDGVMSRSAKILSKFYKKNK